MNYSKLRLLSAVVLCGSLTSLSCLHADESWTGVAGVGGSGVWDYNNTANWNAGKWTSNTQAANFSDVNHTVPGTVTVDNSAGQVGATQLKFDSGNPGSWDITGGTVAITGELYTAIVDDEGSNPVTIDSNMTVDTTVATDRYNFFDGYGGNLTSNGNITFGAQPYTSNSRRSFIVGAGNNADNIYLNGVYKDSSALGGPALELRAGEGNNDQNHTYINGDISGLTLGLSIGEGNIVIGSSANLGSHQINMYNDEGVSTQNTALYATNRTISNNIYISAKYDTGINTDSPTRFGFGTVGVDSATVSTFTGGIQLDSTNLILDAAENGRAIIASNIGGQAPGGTYTSGSNTVVVDGVSKTGLGTVVLGQNNYGLQGDGLNNYDSMGNYINTTPTPAGTIAMHIKAGTVLLTNGTSGSAFGNNNGLVLIDAAARLAGNGQSTQQVIVAAGGIIAPGDSGADSGTASMGTLNLVGGLTAASGLTLEFKVNGLANDAINLGAGALSLNGTVNVDVSSLGTVKTWTQATGAQYYTFMTGTGNWTSSNPNFDITAPTGYLVEHTIFDTTNHDFEVEFRAVPEPSTWAMMLGGLAFLGFCIRRKNRTV